LGVWLVATYVLAAGLANAGSMATAGTRASISVDGAAFERSDGATTTIAKPVREVIGCLWIVLGFGGVLLAFASGVFAPVVAVLLAGVAMEVCT